MMNYPLYFESSNGQIHVSASDGDIILVAGPNGVGKSALLSDFYRLLTHGQANYLPGHRQINFNSGSDALAQSIVDLQRNLFQNIDHFSRHKNAWAEDHFRSIIKLLSNSESKYNRNFRKDAEMGHINPKEKASIKISPIDTLNVIFESARLPVRFDMSEKGIVAKRGKAEYRIDALSDGERAALFIAGAIITQPKNTVLLIDEPEKHLHPGISGPFIQTALRSRDDICFILASHDVSIIERIGYTKLIHIVDSTVITENPEVRTFKASVEEFNELISESLRRDILGARAKILFIEGEQNSHDLALYSHVYPEMKISPKGGFGKVVESVKALRSLGGEHWVAPFGLIDGDGRDIEERQRLEQAGIYSLPHPSIENLFFLEEAIRCFVEADLSFTKGESFDVRLRTLQTRIPDFAKKARSELVAKRASWAIERELNSKKVSPNDIKNGKVHDIVISVEDIFAKTEAGIDEILNTGEWNLILQFMPIKSTNIPNEVVKILGVSGPLHFDKYKRAIIRQIDIGTPSALIFLEKIRLILPRIDAYSVPNQNKDQNIIKNNVVLFKKSELKE